MVIKILLTSRKMLLDQVVLIMFFKINSSCPSDYYISINLEINASNGGVWYDSSQIYIVGSGNPVYQSIVNLDSSP